MFQNASEKKLFSSSFKNFLVSEISICIWNEEIGFKHRILTQLSNLIHLISFHSFVRVLPSHATSQGPSLAHLRLHQGPCLTPPCLAMGLVWACPQPWGDGLAWPGLASACPCPCPCPWGGWGCPTEASPWDGRACPAYPSSHRVRFVQWTCSSKVHWIGQI